MCGGSPLVFRPLPGDEARKKKKLSSGYCACEGCDRKESQTKRESGCLRRRGREDTTIHVQLVGLEPPHLHLGALTEGKPVFVCDLGGRSLSPSPLYLECE